MPIIYETTVGKLAVKDLDFSSIDSTPPIVPVPVGNGWRLITTSAGDSSIYYIWVKGSPVSSVTSDYIIVDGDEVILVDATISNIVITLFPTPVVGTILTVKKIDNSVNIITINGNGSVIDGLPTKIISNQFTAIKLTYDGTAWFVI